ncbi:polysialyltransferase family glycosyltransferase [Streptomyces sp. NPDC006784]|uniref:polysialyltransferase family glycosyltransferase n=1 Tax=Streptomyces sp. NPDC006784 TaxID=3364764 RepID=UPI0036AF26DA
MRTQVFLAGTLYGAATLAAALDAGCFEPADQRLLLVSNNAATPETAPALETAPGFERLRRRFDRVLSWNETIRPLHPAGWSPRADDAPLWERYLRRMWDLGEGPEDEVTLVLDTLGDEPGAAVAQLFADAPIEAYAGGLAGYGPTGGKLDPLVGARVRRLLHPDLVPGVAPLLLSEFGVRAEPVPAEALRAVVAEFVQEAPPSVATAPRGAALLLGPSPAAPELLSPDEVERLQVGMLRGLAARGHREVVLKPHPAAPADLPRAVEKEAGELGVALSVADPRTPAEVLYKGMRPALVVGCCSTALLTASALYGLPVVRAGTGPLLERLAPYESAERVPLTLVDALLPDLEDGSQDGSAPLPRGEPAALVRAVGFCMQPRVLPELRPEAERYLAERLSPATRRYFTRRRLTVLALPGAVPRQFAFVPRNRAVRRVARRARALKRAALG